MSQGFSFERSSDEARRHIELAKKFLVEGEKLISRDPVQASEKLYKVAEETVKTIAITLKLSEAEKTVKKERWTTGLLESAVINIMRRLKLNELYH